MSQFSPTDKLAIRKSISNYCLRSEHSTAQIHYSQARPYRHLGITPERGFTADCSSFVTGALFWSGDDTHLNVRDPNGRNYDGWGFTGTLLHENIGHQVTGNKKYFVGDLCIYGPAYSTRHVVICRRSGDRNTSIWTSHGSESGPLSVRYWYRSDVLGIFRPKSLL